MPTINIEKDPYIKNKKIFKQSKITFRDNALTVLIGPNGTGKTTLINQVLESLVKADIPYVHYSNLLHGGDRAKEYFGNTNIAAMVSMLERSEGQNIAFTCMQRFSKEFKKANESRKEKNGKEMWILLDTIDSGMDLNNIIDTKLALKSYIDGAMKVGINLVCVVPANSYELAEGEICLFPYDGKEYTFKSYQEYKSFILEKVKEIEARDDANDKLD